jgi:hypothetical protein
MPRSAAVVLVLAALTACNTGPNLDELERARTTWAGQNVQNYEITVRRLCFCATVEPVRVRVVGGQVVSQTIIATGQALDPALAPWYPAVPGLFALVEDAYRRAYKVGATFNRQYGFPESATIDYVGNAIDDELTVTVSDFAPFPALQ